MSEAICQGSHLGLLWECLHSALSLRDGVNGSLHMCVGQLPVLGPLPGSFCGQLGQRGVRGLGGDLLRVCVDLRLCLLGACCFCCLLLLTGGTPAWVCAGYEQCELSSILLTPEWK